MLSKSNYKKGEELFQSSNYSEALSIFEALAKEDPNDANVLTCLSRTIQQTDPGSSPNVIK